MISTQQTTAHMINTRTHAPTHRRTYTRTHVHIYTYIHTYRRSYVHTHIHISVHIPSMRCFFCCCTFSRFLIRRGLVLGFESLHFMHIGIDAVEALLDGIVFSQRFSQLSRRLGERRRRSIVSVLHGEQSTNTETTSTQAHAHKRHRRHITRYGYNNTRVSTSRHTICMGRTHMMIVCVSCRCFFHDVSLSCPHVRLFVVHAVCCCCCPSLLLCCAVVVKRQQRDTDKCDAAC